MWVSGDLKDRLGIRHRKASKNIHASDLETAPMFREPHARSTSEITLSHVYEPTHGSPEPDEKPPVGYTDDSLDADQSTSLPLIQVGSSEIVDVQADQAVSLNMSSRASFYSSNEPIPSPIPPSLFRIGDGEHGERSRATSPPSAPPSMLPGHAHSGSTGLSPDSFEMQVRRSGLQGFQAYPSEETFQSAYLTADETASGPGSIQSWAGGRAI